MARQSADILDDCPNWNLAGAFGEPDADDFPEGLLLRSKCQTSEYQKYLRILFDVNGIQEEVTSEVAISFTKACRKVQAIERAKVSHELDKLILSEEELDALLSDEFGIEDYAVASNSTEFEWSSDVKMYRGGAHDAKQGLYRYGELDHEAWERQHKKLEKVQKMLTEMREKKGLTDVRPATVDIVAAVAKIGRLVHPNQAKRLAVFASDSVVKVGWEGDYTRWVNQPKGVLIFNLVVRNPVVFPSRPIDSRYFQNDFLCDYKGRREIIRFEPWVTDHDGGCMWKSACLALNNARCDYYDLADKALRERLNNISLAQKYVKDLKANISPLKHILDDDVQFYDDCGNKLNEDDMKSQVQKYVPKSLRQAHVKYCSKTVNVVYNISRDIEFSVKGNHDELPKTITVRDVEIDLGPVDFGRHLALLDQHREFEKLRNMQRRILYFTNTDSGPMTLDLADKILSFLEPSTFDWTDTAVRWHTRLYDPHGGPPRFRCPKHRHHPVFQKVFVDQGIFHFPELEEISSDEVDEDSEESLSDAEDSG